MLTRFIALAFCLAALIGGRVPAATPALAEANASLKAPADRPGEGLPTYEVWKAACDRLPANRSLQNRFPPKHLLPLPRFSDFEQGLGAFFRESVTGRMSQGTNWVGAPPDGAFFDTNSAYFTKRAGRGGESDFQPFAQKLVVPPDAEVFVRGDLHGDIRSLMSNLDWLNRHDYLRGFDVIRPNFYMLFLGDFTDRGWYGIEVLYTLYRLKAANPERVFLARGNHEDISLQARYGFMEEGRSKYGTAFNPAKIARGHDFLPVVIYLGSGGNFIQCNHGGMEPGYNPRSLLAAKGEIGFELLGVLQEQTFLVQNPEWLAGADANARSLARRAFRDFRPEDPIAPSVLGFMWNDFSVLSGEPEFTVDPGRAFVYGRRATDYLLQKASAPGAVVQSVFRAHQHSAVLNPLMRRLAASDGVFRHWQANDSPALLNAAISKLQGQLEVTEERPIPPGSVWTFNVGPDSYYGEGCNYNFDTFGLLKVAQNFEDWRLKRINITVPIN